MKRPRWTLVRDTIPARPAVIEPYKSARIDADPDKPILSVRGLSKQFGSLVTADKIDLDVFPYRLHSFIGPNGAGKTTFFNMLTGVLQPTAGRIVFDGQDVTRMAMFTRSGKEPASRVLANDPSFLNCNVITYGAVT
ncbi:ATP-binding cassette domain-containing protein [Paraburkholderia sp. RAU2J]|uniref:ATP-binding cassette domain-containing protein n=1 Tax=Paraburkholderia sp. RAU2J TaxID=1938810 RepID=UPI001F53EA32|nr:ATP-binding cassette domain-containing protein [Paraburkholderia sp. RAU2J]